VFDTFFPFSVSKISGVAEEFGTPVWLYHQPTIEARIQELSVFDTVRYAQKANSSLALLALMKKKGVVVDAVSAGEIVRALRVGYGENGSKHDIVFTADIFDRDALQLIKEHNLPVNIGSPDMLVQLKEAGLRPDVIIRVNPGFGHGHSKKVNTGGDLSKHGIWHGQLPQVYALARDLDIPIVGLHMHIGSGSDFHHLSQVAEAMVQAAADFGPGLQIISAGGGLPVDYHKPAGERIDVQKYYEVWDNTRKQIEKNSGTSVRLEVEPGRYLVAESGFLITRICSIKQMGDNWFYLVDAGFSDLVRPAFYGAYHHISILAADGRTLNESKDAVVAGPLCESCDVFTQEDGGFVTTRELPSAKVGDYLVIHDAGAYGAAMSSNYNSRLLAPELLLQGDDSVQVIRKRQTFDQLLQNEIIPQSL
jgi:diaminopimelate decarboxylase